MSEFCLSNAGKRVAAAHRSQTVKFELMLMKIPNHHICILHDKIFKYMNSIHTRPGEWRKQKQNVAKTIRLVEACTFEEERGT